VTNDPDHPEGRSLGGVAGGEIMAIIKHVGYHLRSGMANTFRLRADLTEAKDFSVVTLITISSPIATFDPGQFVPPGQMPLPGQGNFKLEGANNELIRFVATPTKMLIIDDGDGDLTITLYSEPNPVPNVSNPDSFQAIPSLISS
jgi:hypothetical protein